MTVGDMSALPIEVDLPLAAAFRAASVLPTSAPVQAVDYSSAGVTLIIGAADIALAWAERLQDSLEVSVLITSAIGHEELPPRQLYQVFAGNNIKLTGWLGEFSASWQTISLPAYGEVGALDFNQVGTSHTGKFDMIFDLSTEALIRLPHPPQGYVAAGTDPVVQFEAALKLSHLIGEFEKPRYFAYKAEQCAHSRNGIVGCNKCIDICSTGAISADGNGIKVEPHLCMGCGACASVCPTGAMRYAFPPVPDLGARIKTMLTAYTQAGGVDPVLLFHERKGEDLWLRLGHKQQLPSNVIPVGVHDVAGVGPDLMLGALCYGAAHVAVLHAGGAPQSYLDNLHTQLTLAQTIVSGFGYVGTHCSVIDAANPKALHDAFAQLPHDGLGIPAATFNLFTEKRRSLEFCIDHLQKHAPKVVEEIALPANAPFGTLSIDTQKCTLCMACVGACPSKALQDNPELPQLRFIENNCVQCGICVDTCPEKALGKSARLLLTPLAKQPRVLNEAQPFHCVRCGTPFGTRAMVDSMIKRLSGHSLFADAKAQRRLQMCGDCRVIDMMENPKEMTVEDLPR